MRCLTVIFAILFFSCNQGGKKDPVVKDPSPSTVDTLADLTHNPGADSINMILAVLPGKYHLVTDAESGWTMDALEYFVYPQRKKDPDYPYIVRGDYNCDGRPDIAALVTDSSAKQVKLAFIYDGDTKINWWKEDMQGAALKNMVKQEFGAMRDEKELKVSLPCDAVEAEWFEKATQVIFWNGRKFENVWTAD